MRTVERRVIQAAVLAVVALAFVAELSYAVVVNRLNAAQPGLPSYALVPWYSPLVNVLPGCTFVFAGLIAWSLRPRNRVGLLMMGVGVGLLTGDSALINAARQVWFPLALVLEIVSPLWAVVLIHLLLAFPGGRLVSRLDRFVVRSFYVLVPLVALLFQLVQVTMLTRPLPPSGINQPPPYAIYLDVAFATVGYIYFAGLLIGSGLVIRRWFLGGRARRRSLSPLFWPLVPIALFSLLSTGIFLGAAHLSPPTVASVLGGISPWFLVALPVGFLIGLLRSRLDMSSVGGLVVKLSGGLAPEQLQPALARALHDPSLEVGYWLPDQGWFADMEGSRL